MDKIDVAVVNKFNGTNYQQWKFQMMCALRAKGLYGVADGSTPKPEETATDELNTWLQKDACAMFTLTSAMDLNQITIIENCTTAKDILSKLNAIYQLKSETNKMIVHEKFHQYKMNPSDSIAQHVSKVESLAKQVRETGDVLSDTAVMTKILSTLPAKFRNVRQAWFSLEETKQTITNLTARLLDEEASLNSYEEVETALAAVSLNKNKGGKPSATSSGSSSTNSMRSAIYCYNCGKRGHIAKKCRLPPKKKRNEQFETERSNRNNNGASSREVAFNVTENISLPIEESWIMDSGASAHMTYRREYFATFEEDCTSTVILGNNESLTVRGRGTVKIQKLINGKWYDSIINNVLFIPDLRKNLFSEGVIADKGMKIIKENNEAKIYMHDDLVACAVREPNNLYKLLFRTVLINANSTRSDSLQIWHERLGHVNINSLKEMVNKQLVNGVNFNNTENFFCDGCAYGKQHRLPFNRIEREKTQVKAGERIYSDLCGPMNTPSVSGNRYFVTFKDELSGFRVVNFIRNKTDVLDCFKTFNNMVRNNFGRPVKYLHVDNGLEYCNREFKNYLNGQGIQLETTAPYTPEQNGRMERDNRTIIESARSMIYSSNVPKYLWAEAVNTAVYILNRTPSTQTPNATPFEIWFKKKPILKHIRIFGCEAYTHVPDQKRTKLEPKSKKLILVGYDNNSTNFRLFDVTTRKITISRNVMFNENNKGFTEKSDVVEIGLDKSQIENQLIQNETVKEPIDSLRDTPNPETIPNEDEQDIPNLRPRREVRLPERYREYELNYAEIDVPETYKEALDSEESENWKTAIAEELDALKRNHTWDEVELPPGRKAISSKWVFRVKRNTDGSVSCYKARLCAKGYAQKKDIDYSETFSPTTRFDSIRVLLAVAAAQNYEIQQFDVKTAFLYGDLHEEIYISLPDDMDCKTNLVCKLRKSLYGLKQAPRCWNNKFDNFLQSYGFRQSNADSCVYNGTVHNYKVLLVIYVDDGLLISSSKTSINVILSYLQKDFEIKISEANYFVGIEITRYSDGSIFLSQEAYIKRIIQRFGLENANSVSTPSDPQTNITSVTNSPYLEDDEVPYRQLVGSLMFAAIVTRPDIAHAVGVVSRYLNKHTREHWNAAKRIVRYLISTKDHGIKYETKHKESPLTGYSDSDYAGDIQTRRSTSGYIFLLCGSPVTWTSKRQPTVSLSTTEAEYIAASLATKEAIWLQQLLHDIDESVIKPTVLYSDSQSAIRLIHNPEFHNRTKHVDIKFHFIREKFGCGDILPVYINTKEQLADILTKSLPKNTFCKLKDLLGMKSKHKKDEEDNK